MEKGASSAVNVERLKGQGEGHGWRVCVSGMLAPPIGVRSAMFAERDA